MSVKREYLDMKNLNNIGEPLPDNFVFLGDKTLDAIKTNIQNVIIKELKDSIQNNTKIKSNIENRLKNAHITKTSSFDDNLYNICEALPFNDIDEKDEKKVVWNSPLSKEETDLMPITSEDDPDKQVIIGRVNTIEELFKYNMKPFKILKLNGKTFNWSRIVNDLFISCSYAYAKKISTTNKDRLYFPIMLIIDKICFDLPDEQDIFKNLTMTKEYIDKMVSTSKRILFGKKEFKNTCIINPYSTDPKDYPSVTFWEIAILADLFKMYLYRLKTPETSEQTIYYFSIIDYNKLNDGALLKQFNLDNNTRGYELTKIDIEWALKTEKDTEPQLKTEKDKIVESHMGGYYDKYMKYKNKYINLKNKNL